MQSNSIDSTYRIIKAINDFEGKQYRESQKSKYSKFTTRLYFEIIVFPFCVAVILGFSKRFLGAPGWVSAPGLLALLISYLGIIVHPIVSAILNRKNILKSIRDPFGVILNNSKISAKADRKYFNYLKSKPTSDLKLIQKNLISEKNDFQKRVSFVVGAIEKIGIVPGVLALYVTYTKLSGPVPDWVSMIAYATPILYVLGATAHFYILKLEKMASLLELVIEEKP